jgi:hypothetical protein
VAGDVADAFLEVLQVGAHVQGGAEAAEDDAPELGLRCGGVVLGVADYVEGVVLLPVKEGGAEAVVQDAGVDA